MHLTLNCWFINICKRLITGDIRNRGNVRLSDAVWLLCPPRYQGRFDWRMWPNHLPPRRLRQDSAILSPSGVDSPSNLRRHNFPWQALKLIPSRFWKLVPYRIRTSLPSFIQSYSSQGLITGLSSTNRHGRSPSTRFFQSPAEFIFQSPAEFISGIPNGVYHHYPQRNSSLKSSSAGPSSKTSAEYLFHKTIPRPIVKDLFS